MIPLELFTGPLVAKYLLGNKEAGQYGEKLEPYVVDARCAFCVALQQHTLTKMGVMCCRACDGDACVLVPHGQP